METIKTEQRDYIPEIPRIEPKTLDDEEVFELYRRTARKIGISDEIIKIRVDSLRATSKAMRKEVKLWQQ